MAVLFMSREPTAAARYMPLLQEALPELEIRTWPEIGDPADIVYAVVGPPEPGVLGTLPNLRCHPFDLGRGSTSCWPTRPFRATSPCRVWSIPCWPST